jgi:hypothetical protein
MTPSIFIRLLGEDKEVGLVLAVRDLFEARGNETIHALVAARLRTIPAAPFAYWVNERLRRLFDELSPLSGEDRTLKQGLATADDFRFLRLSWETPAKLSSDPTRCWYSFAKGGSYSPFYADVYLKVNWGADGKEIRFFGDSTGFRPLSRPQNTTFYFRSGLTWPLRTNGLSFRCLPAGCVFAHKGPAAFVENDSSAGLMSLCAIVNSSTFGTLVAAQLARVELAQSFEVGLISTTPVPTQLDPHLGELARIAWEAKRRPDTASLTSHAFVRPALAQLGSSLNNGTHRWSSILTESGVTVAAVRSEIDDVAYRLYGLGDDDRRAIEKTLGGPASGANDSTGASEDDEEVEDSPVAGATGSALVSELLDYALGCAFGRWDIRYATDEQAAPELPDPFAPLPVCPPGQLQNGQGLPARPEDVPAAYPVRIPWDGILVDDPNHPLDLERCVREVIEIIWSGQQGGTTAEAIEHEACEILGVKSLRDYFRKPAGFFVDHLKRNSRSRRQAPIYWPLSTTSSSYTLWIYYHRLTPDTLYKCVQQFVNPKLSDVEKELTHFRTVLTANEGGANEQKRVEELETLRRELIDLRTELELWAPKWKPNLNDGVLITAAPLCKLFRLPKWQKDLKACWQSMDKGYYDWAHLAQSLWPDRVREKCKLDRSLAIAHDLEDLCELKAPVKKQKKVKVVPAVVVPGFEISE